jgi:DNA-binding IscR family transcriptional regulator
LPHDPSQVTLLQAVEHFEGELSLSDCVLIPGECPLDTRCSTYCQWIRLINILRNEMAHITFEQLVAEGNLIEANLTVYNSNTPISIEQLISLGASLPTI